MLAINSIILCACTECIQYVSPLP